ncbi:MAG: GTPase HflX [Proteobacteria bacterium]|nr:GTPase HflX [Pseudomonadota bacterium]
MSSFLERRSNTISSDLTEYVLSVGVQFRDDTLDEVESSLSELDRLIQTLGGKVVETIIQRRIKPDPSLFIGKGKAEEIALLIKEKECDLVAFDQELTGTQQRNLEKILNCRVIDRTGIILDIFSKHARTKEAKNQVELAMLEYLSTHLTRKWTHLERQRGGIGLKGVGEKQIELDRRMIRSRISKLKAEIAHQAQDRSIQRRHRDKFLRVAIVGYTNAGKSTLMNNLTHSNVYVDDRLFATLDSTVRIIDPKTRPPILLSDTVGFIDKLPHGLVASFRSTLQEVLEADVLLHVVDMSSPYFLEQMEVTKNVLEEIGAGTKPTFLVFNKADLVKEIFLPKILERKYIDCVSVSAFRPADMRRLRESIFGYFERDMMDLELTVPYSDTWLQSQIHEFSKVIKKDYLEEGAHFHIRVMRSTANWLGLLEKPGVTIKVNNAG